MVIVGDVNNIPIGTNVLQNELEMEWKISNFSSLTDNFYNSPSFSFADECWYLAISLNGDEDKESFGCIGLYLRRGSSGPPINMNYTLGLKTLNGEKDSEHHRTFIFRDVYEAYGVHGCIVRSELIERNLIPTDVLTLFCNLKDPKHVKGPSK